MSLRRVIIIGSSILVLIVAIVVGVMISGGEDNVSAEDSLNNGNGNGNAAVVPAGTAWYWGEGNPKEAQPKPSGGMFHDGDLYLDTASYDVGRGKATAGAPSPFPP